MSRAGQGERWWSAVMALSLGLPLVWFALLEDLYLPPILMYHAIDAHSGETKLSVSPASFARHMQFLADHGYQVMSLETLIHRLRRRQPIPWKTVVLTLDDGLGSVSSEALPVLRRHGFPATAFIIYDRVGRVEFMSWEEIRQWSAAGLEVGGHTYSHPILSDPALTDEQLRKEISESKRLLEERLGRPITTFGYPGGFMNARVREAVREAGYLGAVGTRVSRWPDRHDLFVLPRLKVTRSADSLVFFWVMVSGAYNGWMARIR